MLKQAVIAPLVAHSLVGAAHAQPTPAQIVESYRTASIEDTPAVPSAFLDDKIATQDGGIVSTNGIIYIHQKINMKTIPFCEFSEALSFLHEIKAGTVKRNPQGDGYQWSSDNEKLDSRQSSYLLAYLGVDTTWTDPVTGLKWLFETANFPRRSYGPEQINFAGHNDWRTPTLSELKTLSSTVKNERRAFVREAVKFSLTGGYSCNTPVRKGSQDDGMVWNFTTNQHSEVKHKEGKIKWGAEGQYAGFDKDTVSGEGSSIYVRGVREDRLSDWAESLVQWAEACQYHNFPVTEETISALDNIYLEKDRFPDQLSKLVNLRSVELCDCKALPKDLVALKKLEILKWNTGMFSVGTDDMVCVLPDDIGDLKCLSTIEVEGVGIRALPSSVSNLSNLRKLLLTRTQVEALPESIGELKNLDELTLSFNKLTTLPASISDMKSLRHLKINEPNVTDLPPEFGRLNTLETIDLNSTSLESLQPNFSNFVQLTELTIQWTKIKFIPDWITKLENLKVLDFSFTRVSKLPSDIGNISKLESLRFIGTLISDLPDSLQKMDELKFIGISGTPLLAIPDWIGNMKSLKNINAARMWNIKKLPRFDGKTFSTYVGMFDQPYGRAWLESIGWPGK